MQRVTKVSSKQEYILEENASSILDKGTLLRGGEGKGKHKRSGLGKNKTVQNSKIPDYLTMASLLNLIEDLKETQNNLEKANKKLRTNEKELWSSREHHRATEEKLQSILTHCPDIILIVNEDGQIQFISKTIKGYTKKDAIGSHILDYIPKDYHKNVRTVIKNVIKTRKPDLYEVTAPGYHGDKSSWITRIVPLISNSKVNQLMLINTDISEIKIVEEALLEGEKKYHALLSTSPDAIIMTDIVGNLISVNHQAALLHGFKNIKEMLSVGKTAFDFIAPEDSQRAMENVKRTLEKGIAKSVEYTLLKKNGVRVPVELSASIIPNAQGGPKGFIGVIRDITERKKSEAALRKSYATMEQKVKDRTDDLLKANKELKSVVSECEATEHELRLSEERFRIVTEGALAGVYIVQNDKFVYVNPALANIFGYSQDELIDKLGPLDLTHSEDYSLVTEQINKRLEKGIQEVHYEFHGIRKDGKKIHCEVMGRKHDYKGDMATIGVILDITERKKAEEEMKKMLMKYHLKEGRIYLVKESAPTLSFAAFKDLLNVGYRGYVFSRTLEEEFNKLVEGEYEFSRMGEKGDSVLAPDLDKLEFLLEHLSEKNAILIERLDYLIFKNGFSKTLAFVQRLREIAYIEGHTIILSLDPGTQNKKELKLLDKEVSEVEPRLKEGLPEELMDILRFVNKQNVLGLKPSYSDIVRGLDISKPTVQKRLNLLGHGGYLVQMKNGRKKTVEISDKGRNIFNL
jgi:PAS domain S-box-containing protein